MDALKTSLRVVLAHIRQVKIKIVEGIRGRIRLGNFNTLLKKIDTKMENNNFSFLFTPECLR